MSDTTSVQITGKINGKEVFLKKAPEGCINPEAWVEQHREIHESVGITDVTITHLEEKGWIPKL